MEPTPVLPQFVRREYLWNVMLAEANTCHYCNRLREPYHRCDVIKIADVIYANMRAAGAPAA